MKTVHLYGYLAEKYGSILKFEVSTIQELMKAMKTNFNDWENTIRDDEFEVVVGKDLDSNHLSEVELTLKFNKGDFHIAPLIESRKEGWIKVIVGVVLIIVGIICFATPFGVPLIIAGSSMIIGGVIQLISGPPTVGDYSERESPSERASFLFKGGVNNIEQGGPVPLVYGEIITGSTVVSASILNEGI